MGGADAATIASDSFQRIVATGWGTADTGGAWTTSVPANSAVLPGAGTMVGTAPAGTRLATLGGIQQADVDIDATWSTDKLTNGGGTYVSLVARRALGGNEYRAQVQLKSSGVAQAGISRMQNKTQTMLAATPVAGLSYKPGTVLHSRFQVDGSALRFKVWPATAAEPANWLLDVTDAAGLKAPGTIGIMQYVSGSSTQLPVTLSVRSFVAKTLEPVVVTTTTAKPVVTTTTAKPVVTTTTAQPAATTTTTVPTPPVEVDGRGTVVGWANYAVPTGAIVVSPSGSDSAAGTAAAPLKTLNAAIAQAPSGSTIVLRAGSYNESATIPNTKKLTIQSWPREAVWLDGSVAVTGFAQSGSTWRLDGWTYEFDHSPTETRGAPDNTAANWQYINTSYPMAAHPDQIWIDGVAQRQVGSLADVGAGSFFHDEAANRIYLGTNPSGKAVRASTLQQALKIKGDGSVVRGIGIRRYATSVPDFGTVLVDHANDVVAEHIAIVDNATVGLYINGEGATLRNVELSRNGMIGMRATTADGLLIDSVRIEGNNSENFNTAPVAGGIKFSRTRTVTVKDSLIQRNKGTGLWFDVSNYDIRLTGNELRENGKHGIFLEISAKALVANNLVIDNAGWGIKINNTDLTKVWNNTFFGNNGSIWIVQDKRRPSNFTSGRDNRQPYPDPTMTWVIKSAIISNNVMGYQKGSQPMILSVQDTEKQVTAEQMGVKVNGGIYNRPNNATPQRNVTWSRGATTPMHYKTLPPFQSDTGQEAAGYSIDGPAVVTTDGDVTSAMPAMSGAVALPTDVAAAISKSAGVRRYGAWPR